MVKFYRTSSFVLSLLVGCGMNASVFASCIPSEHAAVGGFFPGLQAKNILKNHKPLGVSHAAGEDDGGTYTATDLDYGSYQVHIVRGVVDKIMIRSPSIRWVKGVSVGAKKNFVEQKFKYSKTAGNKIVSQHEVCSKSNNIYVFFIYMDDVLKGIELIVNRP